MLLKFFWIFPLWWYVWFGINEPSMENLLRILILNLRRSALWDNMLMSLLKLLVCHCGPC